MLILSLELGHAVTTAGNENGILDGNSTCMLKSPGKTARLGWGGCCKPGDL